MPRLSVLDKYDQEEKSKGGIDGVAAILSFEKSILRMLLEPDTKTDTRATNRAWGFMMRLKRRGRVSYSFSLSFWPG